MRVCEGTLQGGPSKFAAYSAIRQWNETHGTSFTYEEILGRTLDDYTFSDFGDWAAYTCKDDQPAVVFGDYDEIETALAYAPPEVDWGVLWLTQQDIAVVYRSPYTKLRHVFYNEGQPLEDCDGTLICDGLQRGTENAFVLPDEVEGSLSFRKKGRRHA